MAKQGRTLFFDRPIYVIGHGNCVGKTEGEGPLGEKFDNIIPDDYYGETSFEKAEVKFQKTALRTALKYADKKAEEIEVICAGDLLNQCIASAYGVRNNGVPFVGLYGACSTMALSLATAGFSILSGYADLAAAVTSSHFGSAERQFRYPLEYGGQRPPSAQRTVTGAGAVILSDSEKSNVKISAVRLGSVVDYGISDLNNMGGAMAPAAADTLKGFFKDTDTRPGQYDLIVSGDLAGVGSSILRDLMRQDGYDITHNYNDCGLMIYDIDGQDAHAGGSGCGCSASVLTAELLPRLERGDIRSLIFMATGALMSPLSVQQKETIPAVAHLILLERTEEK